MGIVPQSKTWGKGLVPGVWERSRLAGHGTGEGGAAYQLSGGKSRLVKTSRVGILSASSEGWLTLDG